VMCDMLCFFKYMERFRPISLWLHDDVAVIVYQFDKGVKLSSGSLSW